MSDRTQPTYEYLHIKVRPGAWRRVITQIANSGVPAAERQGYTVYGLWRSRIGLPLNEGRMMLLHGGDGIVPSAENPVLVGAADVISAKSEILVPVGRSIDIGESLAEGYYMHRRFELQESDWELFLEMSLEAWSQVTEDFGSRIIGLWRIESDTAERVEALMITWYRNMAMWEQSRDREAQARSESLVRHFMRRQQLVELTVVTAMELVPLSRSQKDSRAAEGNAGAA